MKKITIALALVLSTTVVLAQTKAERTKFLEKEIMKFDSSTHCLSNLSSHIGHVFLDDAQKKAQSYENPQEYIDFVTLCYYRDTYLICNYMEKLLKEYAKKFAGYISNPGNIEIIVLREAVTKCNEGVLLFKRQKDDALIDYDVNIYNFKNKYGGAPVQLFQTDDADIKKAIKNCCGSFNPNYWDIKTISSRY